ncbi:hypothetical protein UlMin_032852 [Ulmus minor]
MASPHELNPFALPYCPLRNLYHVSSYLISPPGNHYFFYSEPPVEAVPPTVVRGSSPGRSNRGREQPERRRRLDRRERSDFRNNGRRWLWMEKKNKNKKPSEVLPLVPDENTTTVMIKNIPLKYTADLLKEFIDSHCKMENRKAFAKGGDNSPSAVDFLYLPIDFDSNLNKGYAFVNFTSPKAVYKFYVATNNQNWELFQSTKICKIARAKVQGKEQLKRHFENMVFPCDEDEFLPVLFIPPTDGSNMVTQETVGIRIGKNKK